MSKKPTLKHMQENGTLATRTTARAYTHVLLRKVNNAIAAAAMEFSRQSTVDEAIASAKREHKFDVLWSRAQIGEQAPYRPGQGGYKKFADGSYATFTMWDGFKKLADEAVAKHPTVESAVAAAIERTNAYITQRITEINARREEWVVISWHSRAALAKPDYIGAGDTFKVEAINGGTRGAA